ncbi:MAG: NAD kinase [Bacteroidetes bacterium]|nr:NAD kinase [Bacteroidota bacterium]
MTTFALYARCVKDNSCDYVKTLSTRLVKEGIQLIIHKTYFDFLKKEYQFNLDIPTFASHQELKAYKPDYLISLGGDGTMLETLDYIRDTGVPVLGINTGRLGFLAGVYKEEYTNAIDKLIHKRYTIDTRSLLCLKSPAHAFEVNYALNECTLIKKDSSSMLSIDVHANDIFLNSYWADGLIIATPTGSTAYSLSCGGPILEPSSKNFILTPIAPHNLNVRPIVINDEIELKMKIKGRDKQNLISLDSKQATLANEEEIVLKKADFCFNLINLEGQNFFNTLRNKLMWGLDKRN